MSGWPEVTRDQPFQYLAELRSHALAEIRALVLRYGSGEWPGEIPATVFERLVELTVTLAETDRAIFEAARRSKQP